MARTVYSTRFLAISIVDTSVQYIVPDGKVAVIRSITQFYYGGPTAAIAFVQANGTNVIIARLQNLNGYDYSNQTMHQVVDAGDPITISASADNPCHFAVSGYLLDLP